MCKRGLSVFIFYIIIKFVLLSIPDSNDFNYTNISVIFEPDEDTAEINEKSTPIFATDDDINESIEQVFAAELVLVSSLDTATVDLSIRSTLCRIIDNDRE